ncbi:MAG: AAA family ATPase [Eubacteriales bacterium]
MTATFGKLDGAVLEFHDGLNIINAPNEFGKSTWTAFILTMLYGMETAQRATKNSLPIKTKYRPWGGKPMEGAMEILWNGQEITLHRTSGKRNQMEDFSAFYTQTGEIVPFLTSENCGTTLLGVERGTYERSGFIGQQTLAIGSDDTLETRLMALVTTGDEDVSYSQTRKKLVELRNRRRHNKTGLLPQAESMLFDVETSINSLSRLHAEREAVAEEMEILQENYMLLQKHHKSEASQQIIDAKVKLNDKVSILSELATKTAYFLDKDSLFALERLRAQLEVAQASQDGNVPATPSPPDCPMGFEGLSTDGVKHRFQSVSSQLFHLKNPVDTPKNFKFWPVLLLIPLAVFAYILSPYYIIIPLVGGVVCLYLYGKSKKNQANWQDEEIRRKEDIRAIFEQFGVASQAELEENYQFYWQKRLVYEHDFEKHNTDMQIFQEKNQDFYAKYQSFSHQYETFFSPVSHLSNARETILEAVRLLQDLEVAQREMEAAQGQYDTIVRLAGNQVPASLAQSNEELRISREKLAKLDGQIAGYDDFQALVDRAQDLHSRIARLTQEYEALSFATDALDRANAQLQTRFSPALNQSASEFFSKITNGKYDTIFVGKAMKLQVREAESIPNRGVLHLSGGTLDQLYLAVRLAIHQLVLGDGVPLVLDDALAFFDDQRGETALKLLLDISKTSQIILFTCHNRENNWI